MDKKPRIYGYNGCCLPFSKSLNDVIGEDPVGEFMTVIGFPVLIKRENFKLIREHITKRMKVDTFEEAFKLICDKYEREYSQIDLMIHYLWYYNRDDYSWHIKDVSNANDKIFRKRMTSDPIVLSKDRPIIGVMKHANHLKYSLDLFNLIYDYVCLASDMKAGYCNRFQQDNITEGTVKNLFVGRLVQTAYWKERKMPEREPISESAWSTDDFNYKDAYKVHLKNIQMRRTPWNWKETFGIK